MAITMNQITKSEVTGYAKHRRLRAALNKKLYEVAPIIRKYTFWKDEETNELRYTSTLGTSNDSPVVRAFGLSDARIANVKIEETIDEDKGTTRGRRVNIAPDGRYPLSENVILVKADKAILEDFTKNGLVVDGERYEVASVSPSQEKLSCKYFARITEEVPDQMAVFNILEKINGYVFSKGVFNKAQNGSKILKANSRLGMFGSNMQCLYSIDLNKYCIAVVDSKEIDSIYGAFDYSPETKAMMDKMGIKIDNHINDGAKYYSITVIQEMFRGLGEEITEEEALRVAVQSRANYLTTKCMARALRQEQLKALAKMYKAKFYGNTDGEIALLVDADGAKLINKIDLENKTAVIDCYVMAMANASTPHSSGQHLIKYVVEDVEATLSTIERMTKDALDGYLVGQLLDGNNQSSVYAKIRTLMGEESLQSRMLVESLIKDLITYATSIVAKNRLAIDGIYSHMMFDLSYSLTNGQINNVLGINRFGLIEAYSPDVCRKYAKEIKAIETNKSLSEEDKEIQLQELLSAVVVKFPSAMPDEYETVVYLTDKQIKAKIEALKINNKMKKVLVDYFVHTPWGCTVFAPINTLKNKLAGADVDFDACMSDMSELKHILVNKRMKQTKELGFCTFISYEDIDRTPVEETDLEDELSSLDM